jgi:hypothetical protein
LEDIALQLCGSRSTERIKIEAERLRLTFPRQGKDFRPAQKYQKRSRNSRKPSTSEEILSPEAMIKKRRSEWLKVLNENAGFARTQLRDKYTSLYKWLAQNDKGWLRSHLPPRKDHIFNWADLDARLVGMVKLSAERIRNFDTPCRITAFSIGKDTNSYEYLRKNLDKLPQTFAALNEVLETKIDFAKRQLKFAAASFANQGYSASRSELLAVARISRDMRYAPEMQPAIDSVLQALR